MAERRIPRNCEHCGAPFEVRLSNSYGRRGRFCSRSCAATVPRAPRDRRPLAQRLWEKVTVTEGCWFYTGCINKCGYGQITVCGRGKRIYTHVAAYLVAVGPIPEGMEVCHDCDKNYPPGDITYRQCVRPDHLFLGTRAENAADMVRKRRNHLGSARPESKLTEEQVVEMRQLHRDGDSQVALGKRFNISSRTVSDIVTGKMWRHVPL